MMKVYCRFNVEALKRFSTDACGAQTGRYGEDHGGVGYNKIFNIKLDNGKEVIARIPTPLAGPNHFVRSQLWTMFAHVLDYQHPLFLLGAQMRLVHQSSRSISSWKRLRELSWAASGTKYES